ncbi:M20 family peptidase, partial [Pectobacterium versatile]|nr:M20 family peptidase [Pectobacterium versatile]
RRYAPEESFDAVWQKLTDCITQSMTASAALSTEYHLIGHLAPVSDPTGPHWPRWQQALGMGFGFRADEFAAWGSS